MWYSRIGQTGLLKNRDINASKTAAFQSKAALSVSNQIKIHRKTDAVELWVAVINAWLA